MQDPSQGVEQLLQNHVHLVSNHRFPIVATLSIDLAHRYLLDAPVIVKQLRPMSWIYVQAPQDGTIWLEWLPNNHDPRFPSDGYVWGDPENTFRHEFGGYTIEVLTHTVGFRPHYDQMASHARTRYHFVAKNPSVHAAAPDPSLWIVHYHPAEPGRILPAQSVPLSPQMRQIMQERHWLESQGRLEKKDFMLHDRQQWPIIQLPGGARAQQQMQQPGFYGSNPMGPPMGQAGPTGGWPQQPPLKRVRQNPPSTMPGASDGVHDTSIEDEENTAVGDFFDHLTPREISMARYHQHHRWMEEVFSSPYATSRIVPTDLGLGLIGELKGLTDGILEPPSVADFTERSAERQPKPKGTSAFTNLKKEQIDEFSSRIGKHLVEGLADTEHMKAAHVAKMAQWKRSKMLMQAEKRLRLATWEGHESAVPVFRLEEGAPVNGHAEDGRPRETVEDVVKEVEGLLKSKIRTNEEATLVEKGGLEGEEEPLREVATQGMQKSPPDFATGADAASLPNYHQGLAQSASTTTGQIPLQPSAAQNVAMPDLPASQQQQQHTSSGTADNRQLNPDQSGADLPGLDLDSTSLMDLDVDDTDIDFADSALDASAAEPADMSSNPHPAASAPPSSSLHPTSSIAAVPPTSQSPLPASSASHQAPPPSSASPAPILTNESDVGAAAGADEGAMDSSIFPDTAFDDFTNMGEDVDDGDGDGDGDDAVGDDLLDFEGGDLGGDDSAFGDALHGMESGGEEQGGD